jgi:hypothetical protein
MLFHDVSQQPESTSKVSCNDAVEPEVGLVVELRSDDLSGLLKFLSTNIQNLNVTLYLLIESCQLMTENVRAETRLRTLA